MAGRRGQRPSRIAGRSEDQSSHASLPDGEPTAKDDQSTILASPAVAKESGNMERDINTLMSTPQSGATSSSLFFTADMSRPITRSTRSNQFKGYFESILVGSSSSPSQAHERLRAITVKHLDTATTSRLEEAEDIQYNPTERDIEENNLGDLEATEDRNPIEELQDDELEKGHPTVGGLRIPRRSDRLRAKNGTAREPSPSTALSAVSNCSHRVQKRRKRAPKQTSSVKTPLRRSPRLAKPLVVFHKFPELPAELKLMIWEAAVQPRLAYICNRASFMDHANSFGIQNKIPSWFMTCRMSAYVAKRYYKKMFGKNETVSQIPAALQPVADHPLSAQDINPDVDIVVYEPCHSGCRACYCAQQYRREDRAAVTKLAVQIDSPHLPPSSEPGWVTVTRSWPNLTTLYMMKPAIKGLDRSEKAMIRIEEGTHEQALRKLFEAWKKGAGKNHSLEILEFVRVVEQEADTKNVKDRYQTVEDRKTGTVTDIILG